MKIIYVVSGTTMFGGATKSFITLLNDFCAIDNNKAIVVCPDNQGLYEYISSGKIPGATALIINYTYDILPFLYKPLDYILFIPRLIKRFIKNRMAASKLAKIAKKIHPDAFHTNTSVNNIGYLAAKKLGIPHIWHVREYGKQDFNMTVPFQSRKLSSKNNFTIFITRDIAEHKQRKESIEHTVIYNGIIDDNSLRYKEFDSGYFLYAGKITENKGVLDLIAAFSIYAKRAESIGENVIPLYIAGKSDKDFKAKLDKTIFEEKLGNNVKLLGQRTDVADLMYNAKATVITSFQEGFGRVLPEAMANGSLTIGRNTGGTREQFDNGLRLVGSEIGFRFNDVNELASILETISKKEKYDFKDMIYNSQRVVKELYSIKNYTGNIIKLYHRLLRI